MVHIGKLFPQYHYLGHGINYLYIRVVDICKGNSFICKSFGFGIQSARVGTIRTYKKYAIYLGKLKYP